MITWHTWACYNYQALSKTRLLWLRWTQNGEHWCLFQVALKSFGDGVERADGNGMRGGVQRGSTMDGGEREFIIHCIHTHTGCFLSFYRLEQRQGWWTHWEIKLNYQTWCLLEHSDHRALNHKRSMIMLGFIYLFIESYRLWHDSFVQLCSSRYEWFCVLWCYDALILETPSLNTYHFATELSAEWCVVNSRFLIFIWLDTCRDTDSVLSLCFMVW